MILNTIKLYKTPLDSAYMNVFDSYVSVEQYEYFLTTNYQHLIIELNQSKSIRTSDGLAEIVLPYYQNSVRDYNYLQVTNNDGTYFYFVVGTTSLDDGNTPSTRFELKWDAWSNNYTHSRFTGNVLRETTATGRFFDNNNGTFTIYPNNRMVEMPDFKIKKKCIGSASQLLSNSPYTVLWIRLRMYNELYTSNITEPATAYDFKDLAGVLPSQGSTPIVYLPLAIVNAITRDIVTARYINIGTQIGTQQIECGIGGFIWYDLNGITNQSPTVLNADLTFLPPFTYNVVENGVGSFTINPNATCGPIFTDKNIGSVIKFTKSTPDYNDNTENVASFFVYGYSTVSKVTKLFHPYNSVMDYPDSTSTDKEYNMLYEPVLLNYPFKYTELYVNGEFMPILYPYFEIDCQLNVVVGDTAHAKFRVRYSNDNSQYANNQPPYSNIQLGNFALIRTDQLQSFLANNGEQIKVEQFTKFFNSAIGVTKAVVAPSPTTIIGAVSSVTGSMASLAHLGAKFKDLSNAPDNFNTTSINAFDDMKYQDDILYYECEINDDFMKKSLYDDIHIYGIQSGGYIDFKHNSHNSFDYIIGELEPNCISNANDRVELQSAFMRGITKWHVDGADYDNENVVTMNRNTINIDKEMI